MAVGREDLRRARWGAGVALGEVGEATALERLSALAGNSGAGDEVGPGDDAASWRPSPEGLMLWSTDSICEDVDFRRSYQLPYQVGWKAWMVAVSDLAAMGAQVRGGLVAAILPGESTDQEILAIQLGLVEAAGVDGARIMGGDLGRSEGPLALTVTVMGEVEDGRPVRLSGAAEGDLVVVSGDLGGAAAALNQLEGGMTPVLDELRQHLLEPASRISTGTALRRGGVSAMTDISDGLLLDLERISRASGVAAELWLDHLPLGVRQPGCGDPVALALGGGEDFELLACIPDRQLAGLLGGWGEDLPRLTVIGRVISGSGTRLLARRGGTPLERPRTDGFRHF